MVDKAFFKHDSLLINFFYAKKHSDYRGMMGIPEDVVIVGDSGGFEILSQRSKGKEITIDPLEVLRWEEANCSLRS